MTNDVEDLILDSYKTKAAKANEKQKAYNFYQIIWRYILNAEKYDYNEISINFKVLNIGSQTFINKSEGVCYEIMGNNFELKNLTYFGACRNEEIDNVLNTNIDIDLILKLLKSDDIECQVVKEGKNYYVFINLEKSKVNEIINNVLIKNKRLTKNNRGLI